MTHLAQFRQLRYKNAVNMFRLLFPAMSGWRLQKLVDLAVSYWERPERFA